MTDILMPRLSDSMEQGTISKWLVPDGESFNEGDELAEIETDKAAVIYCAETEGFLEIVLAEGESTSVGSIIGRAHGVERVRTTVLERNRATSVALADQANDPRFSVSDSERVAADLPSRAVAHTSLATPLARRVASAHGLSLADITGTGPRGRITRSDVLGVVQGSPPPMPRALPQNRQPSADSQFGEIEWVPLTSAQGIIVQRMVETKSTVPDFQVQTEVVMDSVIALRSGLNEVGGVDLVPSINDFVVKACALALRHCPRANGSFRGDHFELFSRINIGIAVTDGESLLVPTIFDADQKSLGQISRESRGLAQRVRDHDISPTELSGGTFTVSNLGMFGMTSITPVIYGSQAAIVGVGATRGTLARDGENIIDRSIMTLCASCDHRIIYGADAADLLGRIRALLEAPLALVM